MGVFLRFDAKSEGKKKRVATVKKNLIRGETDVTEGADRIIIFGGHGCCGGKKGLGGNNIATES